MAIRSTFCSSQSLFKAVVVSFSTCAIIGCTSLKTRDDVQRPTGRPDNTVKFPGESGTKDAPAPAVPVPTKKPKVGIILGPGGAKAYAHIGVLKELEKARIPVDHVVGIEFGALVASLYAVNGKANEVEWKMNKLDYSSGNNKGLFRGGPPKVSSLDSFINENFPKKRSSDFSVGFGCPVTSTNSGFVRMSPGGSIKDILHNCVSYPPLFQIEGDQVAGAFGIKEAVDHLRSKGAELVIYVNVLDQGTLFKAKSSEEGKLSSMLWSELRRSQASSHVLVDEVIDVTTRGIEIQDFKEKRKLISLGEQSGSKAASRMSATYGF